MAWTRASRSATPRSMTARGRCGDCTTRPSRTARPSWCAAPQGAIYDVAVDLRPGSPTFRKLVRGRAERGQPARLLHPGGLRPWLPDPPGRQRGALPDVHALRPGRRARRALGRSWVRDLAGPSHRPADARWRSATPAIRTSRCEPPRGDRGHRLHRPGNPEPLIDAGMEVHAVTSRAPLTDAPAGVHWHVADLLTDGAEQGRRSARPTSCTWPGTPSPAGSGAPPSTWTGWRRACA